MASPSPSEPRQPGLFDEAPAAAARSDHAAPIPAVRGTPAPAGAGPVWSVSELTEAVASRLAGLGRIAVEGEVVNLRRAG